MGRFSTVTANVTAPMLTHRATRPIAERTNLSPAIRSAMEELMLDKQGFYAVWPTVSDTVWEMAASNDPRLRRQSLPFRMWRCENQTGDDPADDWTALTREADEYIPDEQLDPLAELLIARFLGDGWLERAHFRRSAAALAHAIGWSNRLGYDEVHTASIASIGFVLTLGGYVTEGLGVITRSAARAIDCATHSFIGVGSHLRQERHQVFELAEADEHTRNFRRAVCGYQMATSLLGPTERADRLNGYLALSRCLARVGKPELAAEIFDELDPAFDDNNLVLWVKHARTRAWVAAGRGEVDEALTSCSHALSPRLRNRAVGLYLELLLDGSSIARDADEPHWIVDNSGGIEHHNVDGVALAPTFAYQDLAWAYRRLGDRTSALRCHQLALMGRARFGARSGFSPTAADSVPGVLRSSRELHERAKRARDKERVSLERGIGSVAHDVRNQLQSLEFLAGIGGWGEAEVSTVRSIVASIDDMLSDLLRDVDADREIELTDVSLSVIVQGVMDRFRSTANHKNIDLTCSLKRSIVCRSDPLALDRIISNLVSNAIKYSPVGGSVEITCNSLGESFIDVHIIDSGPGVPAAEVDDLFRWGGKLSSEPTGGETQQGIGLFTAQRLARLTGASIQPHPRRQSSPSTMSVRLRRSRR